MISSTLKIKLIIYLYSVNLSKQRHIIASNIDISILVVTLNNPNTSTNFIDRFLVSCQAYDIPVIIAFNKIDTYKGGDNDESERMIKIYKKIGYSCELISAKYGNGIDGVIELMKNKTCIISGHSGVGKSTLINSISPKLKLKTKEISSSHNQGKHTTTYAEMFDLDANIRVIDTPGIKGFGVVDFEPHQITDYFPEFFKLKSKCKFNNCLHIHEPKCAVKEALDVDEIAISRYRSYLQILDGEEEHYRTDNFEKE